MNNDTASSGYSDGVGSGGEKHVIYAVTFGGHLFHDLFLKDHGGNMAPSPAL